MLSGNNNGIFVNLKRIYKYVRQDASNARKLLEEIICK